MGPWPPNELDAGAEELGTDTGAADAALDATPADTPDEDSDLVDAKTGSVVSVTDNPAALLAWSSDSVSIQLNMQRTLRSCLSTASNITL